MRSSQISPVSWSASYLLRVPLGISTTTSTSMASWLTDRPRWLAGGQRSHPGGSVGGVQRRWLCSACGQTAVAADIGDVGDVGPPLACRNGWCTGAERPLEAIFAVGNYEGALRKAIVSYKYRRDVRWAPVFGRLLHGFLVRHATWFEEYGVICPVPSFTGHGARRAWGHTELVCAEMGWLSGGDWPVESLVTKVAETEPMSAKALVARGVIAKTLLQEGFAGAPTAA